MKHLSLILVLLAAPALAAPSPEAKCLGAKIQAFGKAVDARSQCQAEARAKQRPVDPVCLAKAEAKLREQFAKAEKVGTCQTPPIDAVVAIIAACVTSFDGAVEGAPSCAAAKIKAAAKKTAGVRTCQKKSLLKGADFDACKAKVEAKFAKAVAKAESKNGCTGTADALSALVSTCLAAIPPPIPCDGGTHPTCGGTCPDGLTCRPYEVFTGGASTETGCSCVDVATGPSCDGNYCGSDQHCADPTHVCERWMGADDCDHMICQPALTTPTTLPIDDKIIECTDGEYPTCGGTCPEGLRCQRFLANFNDVPTFSGCVCVDPREPRCDEGGNACIAQQVPWLHCADPSQACIVDLSGSGDEPQCVRTRCDEPPPVVITTTSSTTTSSSTSSTTTTSVTTTSSTIICTSTPATSGKFQDLGNCTILDTTTGLQWEKKSDDIPGGLHDVEARYRWAGCCDFDCSTAELHCQPDAAASAACFAGAEGTEGCALCATGTCRLFDPEATTTAWGWVAKVNADNFAGHSDWRLAKENGFNPGPNELESILLRPEPCGTAPLPCIDPIFGPTKADLHWSATTKGATGPTRPSDGWWVDFLTGGYGDGGKGGMLFVRAVRTASP